MYPKTGRNSIVVRDILQPNLNAKPKTFFFSSSLCHHNTVLFSLNLSFPSLIVTFFEIKVSSIKELLVRPQIFHPQMLPSP
ncbi:uncharacterized protein OCT59_023571 [Rhizophagus irregularis]|uniref:uncharacterized protein n=1 Tax=Rhizophagus irregularis TaxID=588596 RepID=UPI003333495F|nr:hypothetical protein OCT59_023571 [Rhizophagus irregularis]